MAFTLVVIALLILAGFVAWSQSALLGTGPDQIDSLVVAYSPYEAGTLLWIAKDQHFFEKNGLHLTLKKYDSGAASLDGVENGEADITVGISEFPLIRKAFLNASIRAIGNIDKGEFIYLIASKERVGNISNLEGKRVGTAMGTIAEFHLGRFLTLHGMTIRDITLVDTKTPEEWVNAVADGDIDAVSTAQPYADAARERLGDDAVVWPVQSSQSVFSLIVTTDDWIAKHPDVAVRLLRSFADAEEYLTTHPAESKAIVQEELNLDAGYMDMVWEQNQFSLTLDQSLITAMEDEARWMIRNNLTNATTIPDFRKYLYVDGLDTVKPRSVSIIR
jgi:ABC-type nitrate/sulfonate/bicarbonate transport system substrate-binding protein